MSPDVATAKGAGMVLARGRFDQVKIEALMREHGAQVEQGSFWRRDRDPFNGNDVGCLERVRLVDDQAVVLRPAPSRTGDLDNGPSAAGNLPQRRR